MTAGVAYPILIVEDNEGDALLLRVMLEDALPGQVSIQCAGSLAEALPLAAQTPHPLVMLDLSLPDSWGPETFRTLRAGAPHCAIVVMSGLSDESIALGLVREGAQDYLVKGQVDSSIMGRVVRYAWERQRIERELDQRRVSWEALIRAIPDALIIFDQEQIVLFANEAAQRLWERTDEQFRGLSCRELFLEGFGTALYRQGACLDGFEGLARSEPRQAMVVTAQGSEVPVEVKLSCYELDEGVRMVSVVRDLTERRKLERLLVHTQKMEALGHLTAGIAHDFNNLLGVIVGNLDLLSRQIAGQPGPEKRVRVAESAALRGADLTKRLLAFSRTQDLRPQSVDVSHLLQSFVEMAERTVGPEIRVETKLTSDLPKVFADPSELENVLLNLTVNARDAMPNGGSLFYTCEWVRVTFDDLLVRSEELSPGRFVVLGVTDTGTGMPKEVIEKVFEPFFTTKEKGKGTGLGLSMVYGYAKQSGGTVRIYSEVGEGTSVRLFLPVAERTDEDALSARRQIHFRPPAGATALVVDDEPEMLEVAAFYARDLGFDVLTADSGPAALAVLGDRDDLWLLITDVLMPGGMNGGQLAQAVRERIPGIRVVFTSGFPSQALADKKVLLDSVVVTKPYVFGDLVEALAEIYPNWTRKGISVIGTGFE